ncbi:hypothetical protein ASG80_06075 [Agromyces sp. Soil535]|nr:hypothetical protein [Agromyces sp. Soil535]KRE23295.1 hypothetical protein ASG80_06075 [Agromyces sp. Soil535]
MTTPQGVHLVGSINLPDVETTMRSAAEILGRRVRRIPDGEVGERFHWIAWQPNRLDSTDGLERVGEPGYLVGGVLDVRPLRIADGIDALELKLPNLGYADEARSSWAVFKRLRDEGVIAAGTRFQVSLPTPTAVVGAFIVPEDRARFEPLYRDALFAELDRILDVIPHDDLAIQWDCAVEFGYIENAGYDKRDNAGFLPWFDDVWSGVIARAVEQAARVPDDVEVGFHLCYGDVGERHYVEPEDTGNLAAFAQRLLDASHRGISWIHLPVPIERDDDAYFEPLERLAVPEHTELYLGLVHREDGAEGAERRIATAQRHVDRFGVATECGIGRAPADATLPLLRIHAAVAQPWPAL